MQVSIPKLSLKTRLRKLVPFLLLILAVSILAISVATFKKAGVIQMVASDGQVLNATHPRQDSALVRHGDNLYIAYLSKDLLVKIITLNNQTGDRITNVVDPSPVADDHGYPSIAVDHRGYLHIVYDGHSRPLRYRRSAVPNSASLWEEATMIGEVATYPHLVIDSNDYLYLSYRERTKELKDWQQRIAIRSPDGKWTHPIIVIDALADGDNCTVYVSRMILSMVPNGNEGIFLLWHWWDYTLTSRESGSSDLIPGRPRDVCYAASFDGGRTWQRANSTPYNLPIRKAKADYIYKGDDVIYFAGLTVDSRGVPHVLYSCGSSWSSSRTYHAKWEGRWVINLVGQNIVSPTLTVDASGVLHGFAMTRTKSAGLYEIVYLRSENEGTSWILKYVTAESRYPQRYPVLRNATNDQILDLVWSSQRQDNREEVYLLSISTSAILEYLSSRIT